MVQFHNKTISAGRQYVGARVRARQLGEAGGVGHLQPPSPQKMASTPGFGVVQKLGNLLLKMESNSKNREFLFQSGLNPGKN